MKRIQRLTHNRNFPIFFILLSGFILALFIFSDFGASGDEPNYYQYADSTLKAYSLSDRLAGTFQLDSTFGPADLRLYGPAFLVVGEGIHALLSLFSPHSLSIDLWHLTNYLSFLLGVFFFYKLAQRWVDTIAATISTLLFASQPVLFGLSWINPKDIPLMIFFMGAIYLGLVFCDHAGLAFGGGIQATKTEDILPYQERGITKKEQKLAITINILLCMFSLILVIGAPTIRKIIANTILSINVNNPVGFIDKTFLTFVHSAKNTPLNYYIDKAITVFNLLLAWFLAITILCLVVTIIYFRFSKFFTKQIHLLENFLRKSKKDVANYPQKKALILSFIGACFLLGFACATRLVGPLAALLVVWVWVVNLKKKSIPLVALYGLVSIIIFFIFWPYLWQNTWGNLIYVVQRMSNFPDRHWVMFGGILYDSRALPMSYLPSLLVKTLTEPAIILIVMGLGVIIYRFIKNDIHRSEILVPLVWFLVPFFYILITMPNLYNNYRHVLFMLPAAFLFSGFSLECLFKYLRNHWLNALIIFATLFPGFLADVHLHPYEYAYYNSIAGGIQGAAHRYEVDYWMTCYKDLTQQINANEKGQVKVYVDIEPEIVNIYASDNIVVKKLDETANIVYPSRSLILLPLRWEHELLFPNYPIVYSVNLDGVELCVAKRVQ
jgi:hypothetical protein